ncbi:MAG TPA: FAD-binding protein [Solirubrobacteraceae bacterium]|nr:FAD-binding protein [Solirubrobacteraceae bacterium]
MTEAGTGGGLPASLLRRLVEACGSTHVISDATTLATLRSDAGRRPGGLPGVAVLPGDVDAVRAVVRACVEARVPWVLRGAGTGLAGGARPVPGGVLIVLTRLRRVLEVALEDGRVVVEAGVSLATVASRVAPTHVLPPDPLSARVATVGGAIATDAGGPRSLKYGTVGDYVDGLDVVLPDGGLLHLRRGGAGFDLLGPLIGSAGRLGIIVAAHLRVLPTPEVTCILVTRWPSLLDAARAARALCASPVTPAALELLDDLALRALADAGGDRRLATHLGGAALVVELDGPREDLALALETTLEICGTHGVLDARVCLEPGDQEAIWATLGLGHVALRRVMADFLLGDLAVPPAQLVPALAGLAERASASGLRVAQLARGEGILHPVIAVEGGDLARAEALLAEMATHCRALGGRAGAEFGDEPAAEGRPGGLPELGASFDPHGLLGSGAEPDSARGRGVAPA